MYISPKMNSLEDLEAADTTEDDQSSAMPFKSSVYQPLKISSRFSIEMEILSIGVNNFGSFILPYLYLLC